MIKKTSLIALVMCGTIGSAFADTTSNTKITDNTNAVTTDSSSAIMAYSLQQQINILNKKLAAVTSTDAATSTSTKTSTTTESSSSAPSIFFDVDKGKGYTPVSQLNSSQFAKSLLSERNKFGDSALVIGGDVEFDAQYWSGDAAGSHGSDAVPGVAGTPASPGHPATQGTPYQPAVASTYYKDGKGVYLTDATISFQGNIGHWLTTVVELDGDQDTSPSVSTAAMVVGNLKDHPYYMSVGKTRVSVGNFEGAGEWSSPLTLMFKPGHVGNIKFGYYKDGLNVVFTGFTGTHTDYTTTPLMTYNDNKLDFALSAFYSHAMNKDLTLSANAGYIYDVAGSGTAIHVTNGDRESIAHIEGGVTFKEFNLTAGYNTTLNKNVMFDNAGKHVAKNASAFHVSFTYSPVILGKTTDFRATYSEAKNTGNIVSGLPGGVTTSNNIASGIKKQYILTADRSIFNDNITVGPEFVQSVGYHGKKFNAFTVDMVAYF